MKIVIIEWDGKQPPTTFYNSMHRLHLFVRGDKNDDPVVRRSRKEDHSVVAQEGAVLVESDSLARQVAYLAQNCGARSVFVGDCDFPEDATGRKMTEAELEVVNRFRKVFQQRGRPTDKEERTYVVTCPECAQTSVRKSERVVIQCPHCGGLRAASRVGKVNVFSHYPANLDEWKDMYLASGYWEEPEFDSGLPDQPPASVTLSGKDLEVFEGIMRSKLIMDNIVPLIQDKVYRDILNDIFVSRRYFSAKDRQHSRTALVVDLLEKGINASLLPLFESDSDYDVLDAAIISRHYQNIRLFYIKLNSPKKGE